MSSWHIVALGPNVDRVRQLASAVEGNGLSVHFAPDVKSAAAIGRPSLLLLASDPGTTETDNLLRALRATAELSATPIVLVTDDHADAHFAKHFRSGVIDLLSPPVDAERLKKTVSELRYRTGTIHGRGNRRDLQQLIMHVRRTHRSGALTVNAKTAGEGFAMFLSGELQSASYYDSKGQTALVSMLASASTWTFAEIGGSQMPGVGAVIHVEDPGVELELEIEGMPAEEPAPRAAIPLLLVDDDPELCRMFSAILRKRGFQVTTAIDGVQGYELARANEFEVVVADLAMPRLDGWGLLRQLRDDYRTRELPVAFLSCHEDYRETLRALDAGAQAYLSKSVKADALATQIKALLEPRATVQQLFDNQFQKTFPIDAVGAQWVLEELCRRNVTGRLHAQDAWAKYELIFQNGQVVHAVALAGQHRAEGGRAFNAYIASRGAEASFTPGDLAEGTGSRTLFASLPELLAEAANTLNENERRARESLLVKARQVRVDENLYALYAQVGPSQWLETARLICEEKLPPVEIIAKTDSSPLEVEDTIRDLVRRGVIRLEA